MAQKEVKKVVLAYSGGLDTSVIVRGCRTNTSAKSFASRQTLVRKKNTGLEEKALKSGANKRCTSVTCAKEF